MHSMYHHLYQHAEKAKWGTTWLGPAVLTLMSMGWTLVSFSFLCGEGDLLRRVSAPLGVCLARLYPGHPGPGQVPSHVRLCHNQVQVMQEQPVRQFRSNWHQERLLEDKKTGTRQA